jgi:hypothetical protein
LSEPVRDLNHAERVESAVFLQILAHAAAFGVRRLLMKINARTKFPPEAANASLINWTMAFQNDGH